MPEFMQHVIRERVLSFLDGHNIVGLRLDEFSVDDDGNIITHQKTARLKRGIPYKSVVFAIDFGYCRGTDTGVAQWIYTDSCRAFHGQPNLACAPSGTA